MSFSPPIISKNMPSILAQAVHGLQYVSVGEIEKVATLTAGEGMTSREKRWAYIYAARALIRQEPNYSYVAARLLLDVIYHEALNLDVTENSLLGDYVIKKYSSLLGDYIRHGVALERLSPALLEFDLNALGHAIRPERDLDIQYLGMQTLYDRYFIHEEGRRLETPQIFWMRVAMCPML